ncbi:MAG: hypothetical protein COB30_006455 [Ectothiorhodospiraceae bacterium]|nr:hypothetical protein [Ectothiorhodospiraceae bacterium]
MFFLEKKVLNLPALMVFWILFAPAVVSASDVKAFLIGGVAFGGETLVETSESDLNAGGLLYVGGGVLVEPVNSELIYQLSMGYKFDTVEFEGPNGDASIRVLPLDALVFYKRGKFRFGAGLAYYFNPKSELCFDGFECLTIDFDDAIGFVMELRMQTKNDVFWGARYTNVDYEAGSTSFDASSVRLHVGVTF